MANGDSNPTVTGPEIKRFIDALLQARQPSRNTLSGAQYADVYPPPLQPVPLQHRDEPTSDQQFRSELEAEGLRQLHRPIPEPYVPGLQRDKEGRIQVDERGQPIIHRTKADLISTFLSPLAAAAGASIAGPRYGAGRRFLGNLIAGGVPAGLNYAMTPDIRRAQFAAAQEPYIKQRTELLKALAPLARTPNVKPTAGTVAGQPASAYWDEFNRTWINTETNQPEPGFIPTRYEQTAAGQVAKQNALFPGKVQQAKELGAIRTDEAIRKYNLMTPLAIDRSEKMLLADEPFKVDTAMKTFKAELPDRIRAAKILAGYQSGLVEGRELTRAEQAEQKVASAVTTGSDIWDGMVAHGEKPEENPVQFLNHAYAILQSAAQREGTPAAAANVIPTMKYIAAKLAPNLKSTQMVNAVETLVQSLSGAAGQPQAGAAPAQ